MSHSTRAATITPVAAEPQKSMCQLECSAITAAAGRPSAPPTPREELIRAIADGSRPAGRSSRMMLMPSGMTPIAQPWRARPATIGARELLSALTTEPPTSRPRLSSRMRRLPYMSPSRPSTGVLTAPASSVAVIAQEVLPALACSRAGNSGISGTMRVCMSATTMPASASTTTTVCGEALRSVSFRMGSTPSAGSVASATLSDVTARR
jgi:hypothetical protein